MIQPGVLASAWRHRTLVVGIIAVFGLAAALYSFFRPDVYEALATVVLEDPEATVVLGTDQAVSGDRLVANQLEVVQSGLVATRAAELARDEGYDLSPGQVLGRSTFATLRGTDVIVIGFTSDDPGEAETVANSIVVAYDQVQREQRREANASVESRLDQADTLLREELSSIDQQIDLLRSDRSLSTKIDQVLTRISELQQELSAETDPTIRDSLLSVLEQEDRQLEILRSAADDRIGAGRRGGVARKSRGSSFPARGYRHSEKRHRTANRDRRQRHLLLLACHRYAGFLRRRTRLYDPRWALRRGFGGAERCLCPGQLAPRFHDLG